MSERVVLSDTRRQAGWLPDLHDGPAGRPSEESRRTPGLDRYRQDPSQPHPGFTSWNDFFTRRSKDGQRPVTAPEDDSVIADACESTPARIASGVQRTDRFWVESRPCSPAEMLADDPAVDRFVGGTVDQAFLSADDDHRRHSPVSGSRPSRSGWWRCRPAPVADGTRAGGHVDEGEELGRFQFGGSTHCVIFEPGVVATFEADATLRAEDPHPPLKRVRTVLAHVRRPAPDAG